MNTILRAELIRSNAEVHGVKWAAQQAASKGINIDVVLHALKLRRVGVR